MNKKSIVIKGPLLTQSGYGVHCRQIFSWLSSKEEFDVKCIVTPWGVCSWILDDSQEIIKDIMSKTINEDKSHSFDISFQVQLPNEWNPFLAKKNIGITAAVETDKCNPAWIEHCNNMDHVIVPSNFTKKVLTNTGLSESKISVVNETYPEIFDKIPEKKTNIKELLDNLETKNNFLIFGQITGINSQSDRKNLFNTIKSFISAYKDNKEVGLILKTNTGRNTKIDKNKTINVIKNIAREAGKDVLPKIHVLHGSLTEDELFTLYTHEKVSYLLTATRGEGFGLPLIEAARLGLPIIATSWSGHLDFLKLGNFTRLKYDLKEIDKSRVDNTIFMEGTKWAEVSEGHLRLVLKKAFMDYGKRKKDAKELAEKIKDNFNFKKIKLDYDSVIKGI